MKGGLELEKFAFYNHHSKDSIRQKWTMVLNLGGKLDEEQDICIVFKRLPETAY